MHPVRPQRDGNERGRHYQDRDEAVEFAVSSHAAGRADSDERAAPPRQRPQPQPAHIEHPHRHNRQRLRGRTLVREREHITIDEEQHAGGSGPPDDGGGPVIINAAPSPSRRPHHHHQHHHPPPGYKTSAEHSLDVFRLHGRGLADMHRLRTEASENFHRTVALVSNEVHKRIHEDEKERKVRLEQEMKKAKEAMQQRRRRQREAEELARREIQATWREQDELRVREDALRRREDEERVKEDAGFEEAEAEEEHICIRYRRGSASPEPELERGTARHDCEEAEYQAADEGPASHPHPGSSGSPHRVHFVPDAERRDAAAERPAGEAVYEAPSERPSVDDSAQRRRDEARQRRRAALSRRAGEDARRREEDRRRNREDTERAFAVAYGRLHPSKEDDDGADSHCCDLLLQAMNESGSLQAERWAELRRWCHGVLDELRGLRQWTSSALVLVHGEGSTKTVNNGGEVKVDRKSRIDTRVLRSIAEIPHHQFDGERGSGSWG